MLDFETLIEETIKTSAERKISEVLVESSFRVGTIVSVGGKKGKITSHTGNLKEKDSGKIITPESFTVTFDNGTTRKVSASDMKVEHGSGEHFSSRAQAHFDRAKINRQWHGSSAYNAEISKGHAEMAKFHNFHGNSEKEKESLTLSKHHADLADKADKQNRGGGLHDIPTSGLKHNPSFRQSYPKHTPKQDPTFRHYYDVPFAEKDKAKAKGLKWDANAKKWYKGTWSDTPTKTEWKVSHTVDLRKK